MRFEVTKGVVSAHTRERVRRRRVDEGFGIITLVSEMLREKSGERN